MVLGVDVDAWLSRRDLLRVVGLTSTGLVATGLLAACGGAGTPAAPGATAGAAGVAPPTSAPAAPAAAPASAPTAAAGAAPSTKTPKRGGILKIALNQEANTVDP